MALKKSEIYSTLTKCTNKLRSNSGISAEYFKNYVLILLFLKYLSDRVKSGERTLLTLPEGCSFDDIIKMKGTTNIGEGINKIIAKIIEANGCQDYIILGDHDFCDKKLGNASESSRLISELVTAFQDDGLDFSQNRAADDDLIGDAYEFLMRNFASQAGKDKGQFYTPTEVSRLMALLVGIDLDDRPQITAYDPTCGSGSLLLRVGAAAKHNVSLYGQDIDQTNIELSFLNMIIHGCETADIKVGDTLNNPRHTENGHLQQFDYVVSNPQFSLHNWMNGASANDQYDRWNSAIGVPPQQYGDFAFLLHCLKSLKANGKCAIILPNGVLTRGGEEERLRKWLVTEHLLSGVVAFPANAFFGTSIAGNVLILDKGRTQDGVFFIDASELGYKDADSKIRLREQDIKCVADVWRARKDVPHFAHLATYDRTQREGEESALYEIERNGFALNLSLYVAPVDKEIHQNIEAHLHGGIPEEDIVRLKAYWDACPSLKDALFEPLRPGFLRLKVEQSAIPETVEKDASFVHQAQVFANTLNAWEREIQKEMESVGVDNDPKSVIAYWGQTLLDAFQKSPTLVNAYDVYDQLLGYYNDSLQDDLFMISRDGWQPKLVVPLKKNGAKYTDLICDLLPVEIAIGVFLGERKKALDTKNTQLSSLQEEMEQLLEENEEDFNDSIFHGKLNAKSLKLKLEHCNARQLSLEEREFLTSMLPYFEKSNKTNKTTIAAMRQSHEELFAGVETVTKKSIQALLDNSTNWEYSTTEQRALWGRYAEMLEREKALKDECKELSTKMLEDVLQVYEKLSPESAKSIIIQHKWLAAITERISRQMQEVTNAITTEVTALVKRYEHTLAELNYACHAQENAVLAHLKEMGFDL